jgi:hypothetical protein
MKGLETMPIKIVLICIIMMIVIGVAVWQVGFFLNFKSEKDFKEGVLNVWQSMRTLHSTGDYGSFTTVWLTVPDSCEFNISVGSDRLVAISNGDAFLVNLTSNITAVRGAVGYYTDGDVQFEPGSYTFRLYYGELTENQTRPYTIVFK